MAFRKMLGVFAFGTGVVGGARYTSLVPVKELNLKDITKGEEQIFYGNVTNNDFYLCSRVYYTKTLNNSDFKTMDVQEWHYPRVNVNRD